MMRVITFALLLLFPVVARGGPREVLQEKTLYVESVNRAADAYIAALQAGIERAAQEGAIEEALALRSHSGRFLLGLESPSEFLERRSEAPDETIVERGHSFESVEAGRRAALRQLYKQEITQAGERGELQEAERLQAEAEAFDAGDYAPSEVEVSRRKTLVFARYVAEGDLFVPLSSNSIPDDLKVAALARRIRIWGRCEHDRKSIAGKVRGHFGKAVMFPAARGGRPTRGYLQIAKKGRDVGYALGVVKGQKLIPVLALQDLEAGTVYEWSVQGQRGSLVFEIDREGTRVMSETVPGAARLAIGFASTVRWRGTDAEIVIAIAE
ncbi:MAG: hypothetical protein ACF8TS_19420 [Maioricimonas sp. JB049]